MCLDGNFEGTDVPNTCPDISQNIEDIVPNMENVEVSENYGEFYGDLKQNLENALSRIRDTLFGREVQDVSDAYSEKISDVMGDIFTPSLLNAWPTMSEEQRGRVLDLYARTLGEELDVPIHGAVVSDLFNTYDYGTLGLNADDGWLHIDARLIREPDPMVLLGEQGPLDTVTHEARHQLQREAIDHPDMFPDIPADVIDAWRVNFDSYISPQDDPQGYQEQPVETDARGFAANVLEKYMNKVFGGR